MTHRLHSSPTSAPPPAPALVVITGGPCSGKTTLLNHLATQGFTTVPEAALTIIQRLNAQMGVAAQQCWRKTHPREFQEEVLTLQIRREQSTSARPGEFVFVDRGRLDGLAYLELAGLRPEPDFLQRCLSPRYSAVFLLSPRSVFEARHDTGRTESAEAACAIATRLRQVYEAHGYSIVDVPELPLDQRATFVTRHLGPAE